MWLKPAAKLSVTPLGWGTSPVQKAGKVSQLLLSEISDSK